MASQKIEGGVGIVDMGKALKKVQSCNEVHAGASISEARPLC
jgi:hypothetical protein